MQRQATPPRQGVQPEGGLRRVGVVVVAAAANVVDDGSLRYAVAAATPTKTK